MGAHKLLAQTHDCYDQDLSESNESSCRRILGYDDFERQCITRKRIVRSTSRRDEHDACLQQPPKTRVRVTRKSNKATPANMWKGEAEDIS